MQKDLQQKNFVLYLRYSIHNIQCNKGFISEEVRLYTVPNRDTKSLIKPFFMLIGNELWRQGNVY